MRVMSIFCGYRSDDLSVAYVKIRANNPIGNGLYYIGLSELALLVGQKKKGSVQLHPLFFMAAFH